MLCSRTFAISQNIFFCRLSLPAGCFVKMQSGTKFGKGDKTPSPYTPEQVRTLMEHMVRTEWEMPVVLGGLYGMHRSEVLGLRWRNVDLEKGTFNVVEQQPFHEL